MPPLADCLLDNEQERKAVGSSQKKRVRQEQNGNQSDSDLEYDDETFDSGRNIFDRLRCSTSLISSLLSPSCISVIILILHPFGYYFSQIPSSSSIAELG